MEDIYCASRRRFFIGNLFLCLLCVAFVALFMMMIFVDHASFFWWQWLVAVIGIALSLLASIYYADEIWPMISDALDEAFD
jgi:hypothetical protein